jgi:transcriptional regulator with XRE-family HTH domain
MNSLKTRFGKRLRQVRRERDLTQEQLAEALGVSVEAVSNFERGVHAPSFESLEKLAEVLQVSVYQLFLFPQEGAQSQPGEEGVQRASGTDAGP